MYKNNSGSNDKFKVSAFSKSHCLTESENVYPLLSLYLPLCGIWQQQGLKTNYEKK